MKKIIFAVLVAALISSCKSGVCELELGDVMPEFVLNDTLSSEQLKGKYTLLVFFASWCPGCQAELPYVDSIFVKYGGENQLRILPVAREQTAEDVAELWQTNGFSLPVYPDPERKVYALFAEKTIPRTYLFSPDGALMFKSLGFVPEELAQLSEILNQHLSTPQ